MSYLIIIAVLVIGAIGFTFIQSANAPEQTPPPAVTTEVSAPSTQPASTEPPAAPTESTPAAADNSQVSTYVDGTYTTVVTYQTPARATYSLDITLTVTNDTVTDAQVAYSQGAEKDPNAKRFDNAYKTEVIGKKLDSINLSRVGGASLTTGAFNKALVTIKADAQS